MNSAPKVSVIVPVYNAAVTLERCMDSILGQTLPPGEILVVNDGSTDDSVAVIRSYGDKVSYFEQENQGPAGARNLGLTHAQGDYVTFLDADDYWCPDFLETCVGFLETHPEAIAVSCGQRIKNFGHKEVVRPKLLNSPESQQTSEPQVLPDFFGFWARNNHITVGSVVISRSAVVQAGLMQPTFRICEDLEYWGYLATYGAWGFIPKVLFVCDGTSAAVYQGWFKKHQARWEKTPSVEQWQERIVKRLGAAEHLENFRQMRGVIAKTFAHSKILAGQLQEAREIVKNYGEEFPRNYMTRLMLMGRRTGSLGWLAICKLLLWREYFKAAMVSCFGK